MTLFRSQFLRLGIALLAVGPAARAEAAVSQETEAAEAPQTVSRPQMRKAIAQLIRTEVEHQHLQFTERLPVMASTALPADNVVQMETVVVTTAKLPHLSTPRETPVEEFFRTGTIAEKIGRKVTTRLWMKGDEGVMLRLSW